MLQRLQAYLKAEPDRDVRIWYDADAPRSRRWCVLIDTDISKGVNGYGPSISAAISHALDSADAPQAPDSPLRNPDPPGDPQ